MLDITDRVYSGHDSFLKMFEKPATTSDMLPHYGHTWGGGVGVCVYLCRFYRHFHHCIGHITMGSFFGQRKPVHIFAVCIAVLCQ